MNEIAKAMLIMFLTLACYTLGVMLEQKYKLNKPVNLVLLWVAFCLNSIGFGFMTGIGNRVGGMASASRILGIIALVILMVHAIWGTAVKVLKDEKSARIFHRDSSLLWKVWMVPFVAELLLAIMAI